MIPPLKKPNIAVQRLPFPNQNRQSKGIKQMTLIAAFRSIKGGILLCSDREWNDGYTKRSVDKIFRIREFMPCEFFIAGAGPESIVKKAWSAIHEALDSASSSGVDILRDHVSLLEGALKQVYGQYAQILQQSPMFLLVVVAPREQEAIPILYRTDGEILVSEFSYASAGGGKPISDYFADRLYQYGRIDKDTLKVLAAFIFREAGESSAGVGMGADMMFINEGENAIHFISSGSIKEIETGIPSLSDAIWSYWKEHAKLPERLAG